MLSLFFYVGEKVFSSVIGMNTRCFKNSNLWFGKVCFFSSTQDILYGVLGGKTNGFDFFLSKKAFMMGTQ